jgi:hypothetical protein
VKDKNNINNDAIGKEKETKSSNEIVSLIFQKKNDSPKYFEIEKRKILFFLVGLPSITLLTIAVALTVIIQLSPFRLLEKFNQSKKQDRDQKEIQLIQEANHLALNENARLKSEIETLKLAQANSAIVSHDAKNTIESSNTLTETKCPAPTICPTQVSGVVNSIGLSTISLFKPIQGQKDKTRPAILSLSGFKTVTNRDTVNFQFNIIPTGNEETKISGHIIVLMKNEISIQAYPLQALSGNDFQINYSTGETFATQRFRPVDASFVKPRKSGNYSFTTFIFSRTGDLIHFNTVSLPVKI